MGDLRFLRSGVFWSWAVVTLAITGAFFAWELRLFSLPFFSVVRPPATQFDIAFTAILSILLSIAAGLFGWQRRYGSCPVGTKRTFGFAGTFGGIALLCPVCLALPGIFFGLGTIIAILGQFLPLIRLLAILFAVVAIWMLWPKRA